MRSRMKGFWTQLESERELLRFGFANETEV